MNLLNKSAKQLPLWIGVDNESPPNLTGATENKNKNRPMSPSKQIANESNQDDCVWFLGEVIEYDSKTGCYEIDDIDGEVDDRWRLHKSRVLSLPKYRVDPGINPECLFKNDDVVLALYPQTTCFYRAIVYDVPDSSFGDYMITFEDPSYQSGWSPPIPVCQRYVIRAPEVVLGK